MPSKGPGEDLAAAGDAAIVLSSSELDSSFCFFVAGCGGSLSCWCGLFIGTLNNATAEGTTLN